MKIKKYLQDENRSGLGSKLVSYSALGAALLASGTNLSAQCVDALTPTADIDIDGDGTPDLTINWNTLTTSTNSTSTVPVSGTPLVASGTIATGPIVTSGAGSFNGCSYQFYGGNFVNGSVPVSGSLNRYYDIFLVGLFDYYFNFFATTINYATVAAAGANQIVSTVSGAGVCSAIDSAVGVSGLGTNYYLGINYNYYQYYFQQPQAASAQICYSTTGTVTAGPLVACTTTAGAGTFVIPAAVIGPIGPISSCVTNVGPYANGSVATATNTSSSLVAGASTVAVQFDIGGMTHNGWVELSFDGAQACVVASGFNSCSIDLATTTAGNVAAHSCLAVGEVDPAGGGGCPVLPVQFTNFDVREMGGKVALEWETSSEVNNDFFMIQRSGDSNVWQDLTTVQGSGNSVETKYYNTMDEQPLEGRSYYRLKQVDYNGSYEYSDIQSVYLGAETRDFVLSPNPTSDNLSIEGVLTGRVLVSDTNGRLLGEFQKINGKLNIDVNGYDSGIYFIKILGNDNELLSSKKFVKVD